MLGPYALWWLIAGCCLVVAGVVIPIKDHFRYVRGRGEKAEPFGRITQRLSNGQALTSIERWRWWQMIITWLMIVSGGFILFLCYLDFKLGSGLF